MHKLDDTFKFDKMIKKTKKKPAVENYSKSNLIYDSNHSFSIIIVIVGTLMTFLSNQSILF